MCGIIGIIGSDIKNNLIDGLLKMEYRGYDSCGIAYYKDDEIKVVKNLESPLNLLNDDVYNIGIGHTRWATHGKVALRNAHPVFCSDKRIALVHNGVVENSDEIKNTYLKDINLLTETDTEILANLINYFYEDDLLAAIKKAKDIIKGSYAFLVLDKYEKDRIYLAVSNMPLVIGLGDNLLCVASDILAFNDDIKKYSFIEDNYVGIIKKDSLSDFLFTPFVNSKKECHKTLKNHMYDEILEVPTILENIYKTYFLNNISIKNIKNIIKSKNSITFVASGSSYNACLVAQYFINKHLKIDCYTYLSSEFIYNKYKETDIYFIVSQSGETADTIKALKKIDKDKITISLTNVKQSTISRMSKYNFNMLCNEEISVASTKAFISSIFFMYYLFNEDTYCYIDIIDSINKVINDKDKIKKFVKNFVNEKELFFLGRGIDGIINNENVLKIKEVTYINTNSYFGGELKHGPLALLSNDSKIFVINTSNLTNDIMRINEQEVSTRGGMCYTFSSINNKNDKDTYTFSLDEDANIFPCAIYFQLFAYYLSIEKNINPDRPRNLAKSVTVE